MHSDALTESVFARNRRRVAGLGHVQLGAGLGAGQRLVAIRRAPHRLGLLPAVRVWTGAREEQVPHSNAEAVEFGHLAVQPAAVGAIDVGEHRDGVQRFLRPEDQHLRFGHRVDQGETRVCAQILGEILTGIHVIDIAVEKILAVGGQVADVGSLHELENARYGRWPQILELRSGGQELEQGNSRVRGLGVRHRMRRYAGRRYAGRRIGGRRLRRGGDGGAKAQGDGGKESQHLQSSGETTAIGPRGRPLGSANSSRRGAEPV